MSWALRRTTAPVCCFLAACWLLTGAAAQTTAAAESPVAPPESTKPTAAPEPVKRTSSVEEEQPPIYYLRDKSGNLVAVPDFSYEEFRELYDLKRQLARPQPQYSIQRVTAAGSVVGDRAELNVQFRILVTADRWVGVPLRLGEALLLDVPEYKGPGEQFVHFQGRQEGYVSWIRGQAGQVHELTLKILVPLLRNGEQSRLLVSAPYSTSAELKIKLPVVEPVVRVSKAATVVASNRANNGTELTVRGFEGDFELAWSRPADKAATSGVLEVTGEIIVRIETSSIDTEAQLLVRRHMGTLESFRVRLPPGAELAPETNVGYWVVPVEEGKAAGSQQEVEVRLAKPAADSALVRIKAYRPYPRGKPDVWCQLAGFEVVGAARHSGKICVYAPRDWQVVWGPSEGVRQTDQPPEGAPRENLAAVFEYFVQPYALAARLVQKRTRISVDPEYQVLVSADSLRLDATLKYTIRGARVGALEVGLADWEFEDVGPDSLVVPEGVHIDEHNLLRIPLVQASTGQLEVHLRARRGIAPGSSTIAVNMPQPRVQSLGPAAVAIVPADNVELTPQAEAIVGLVPEVASPLKLPPRQQAAMFYRMEAAKGTFVAGFRVHQQQIDVEVTSRVQLDQAAVRVEQQFTYRVAYEPARFVTLDVPRALLGDTSLQLLVDGKPVTVPLRYPTDQGNPLDAVRMSITLPEQHIGQFQILVRHSKAIGALSDKHSGEVTVPLIMPVDGQLGANVLVVSSPPTVRPQVLTGPWVSTDDVSVPPASPRQHRWIATQRVGAVELVCQPPTDELPLVVVEKAWVCTRLGPQSRIERAWFRFTTRGRELAIHLPTGAILESIKLNNKPVELSSNAARLWLAIPAAEQTAPVEHLLELSYHIEGRPPRGIMELELPTLGPNSPVRRMYWQLALPRNEHLIMTPAGFTGEFLWQWSGYSWGRRPVVSHLDLAAWMGVAASAEAAHTDNTYLLSISGPVDACQLVTASRAIIVLVASGGALLLGLLAIYVPASRHPVSLLMAAGGLLAVGLLYPEPALLAAQAAVLGVVLSIAAAVLDRSLARRGQAQPLPAALMIPHATPGLQPPSDVHPVLRGSTATGPALSPPSGDVKV